MTPRRIGGVLALISAFLPAAARAESAEVASAGLGALGVKVDWAARSLEHKGCPTVPCNAAGGQRVAIELPGASEATVRVEPIAIGQQRSLIHVTVRAKKGDATWEALVAPAEGGGSQVLFAGPTGFTKGEQGERRGDAVAILPGVDDRTRFVGVGSLNESVSLCGEPRTLIAPRFVDPGTMSFRPASAQQLSVARRDAAVEIVASTTKNPPEKPLGRYLVAVGTTDPRTTPAALVDGDPSTRWAEVRSGAGAGEAVILRAPNRVPLNRLTIVPLPPKEKEEDAKKKPAPTPSAEAASLVAPKALYVVTDDKTYAIELPEDAATSRAAFDVRLPQPIKATCIAVVLDEAYTRGLKRPEVTLSEIYAYSELDVPGATLTQVARSLSGGGGAAETAAEILKRSGPPAADAIGSAFTSLDERGRMLGLDVASAAGGCDAGARVAVRALTDPAKDVATRAEKLLIQCANAAVPSLLAAIDTAEPISKGRAAGVLSLVAPNRALKPIMLVLGKGDPQARALLRAAFARAAKRASAETLAELLGEAPREARPDMLRALTGRLGEVRERASLATMEWVEKDPSFAGRYLAIEPLAELARAGDPAATTRYVAMLGGDSEWPVRARASTLAGPVPAAHGALLHALDDAEPRVREAALRAVAEQGNSAAAVRVGALLAQDPWTFVRVAAANALGGMPAAPDLDRSLANSVGDASPRVRVEVLEALGRHRATAFAGPVRERLENEREVLDVRVTAVTTLGRMCDGESLDFFTKAARRLAEPFLERSELDLGVASVRALGAMHPKDLQRRLAPLLNKDVKASVREVATRALAEPAQCR